MIARYALHIAHVISYPVERSCCARCCIFFGIKAELFKERHVKFVIANTVVTAALDHALTLGARGLTINHDSVHSGSHLLIKMMVEPQFRQ